MFSLNQREKRSERREAADQAIDGLASFFKGEGDSEGLPDCFDQLADYEPVNVTLNAGIIRAVLKAASGPR